MNYLQHKPFYLTSDIDHSMKSMLLRYLEIKMHPLIDDACYDKITVIGRHDRKSTIISSKEKPGKKYNWQRPTACTAGGRLTICCFPGRDYVRHYASMIGTYLALTERNPGIVEYTYPNEEDAWSAIQVINLSAIKPKNLVIIGYALDGIFGDASWTEDDSSWQGQYSINNQTVTLLLVKHSFWGDIAGYLMRRLAETGFQRVLFIGKLGSLQSSHRPNECLATGTSSLVEGELVHWRSLFGPSLPDIVKTGTHICVPSVMYETISWVSVATRGFDFVDPEIGHMAREANRAGIGFSYLHLVSDNVVQPHAENLSNERDSGIIAKREIMKQKIANIIATNLVY